ncbi:hypothetical protein L6164_035230 [Bauhinia variegata]|uniref:Uncharacterized protein n=1 Tax=Bauhinia variegata TaxID=167791 RepID=A0ACB9KX43_BAUVA|nr:hypothetical protein L6164_035230 [Bauhinia variegata]
MDILARECPYPRGEGDIAGALYIPQLCQSTSSDGQILNSQDGGDSPVVSLLKSTTSAMVSRGCPSPTSFHILSKQAEAADFLHEANLNGGSLLQCWNMPLLSRVLH